MKRLILGIFLGITMVFQGELPAQEKNLELLLKTDGENVSGQSLLSEIYRKNVSSVVYVTGINVVPAKKSLEEFFQPQPGTAEDYTVGTGFLIHPAGYVLTNAHSVMRSVVPIVELRNGSRYEAQIVSIRPHEDLALLKIEARESLQGVEFEKNEELHVGDTIVTIGCPHGLKYTLTYGIISGMNRGSQVVDIPGLTLKNLLQTDAAINPGSSGGPWFNLRGKVMGMTVSKRGDSDNIGFGISLATLHRVLPQMLGEWIHSRWQLGLEVAEVSSLLPCRVASVGADSPASKAGLETGDLFYSVDEKRIWNPLDFYLALLGKKEGETICLKVIPASEVARRPSSDTLTQTTSSVDSAEVAHPLSDTTWLPQKLKTCEWTLAEKEPVESAGVIRERLGLEVASLTETEFQNERLRTPTGVRITNVEERLYARLEHTPRPGDILARVNYHRPQSPEHLAEILATLPEEQPLDLVILRAETVEQKRHFTRIDVNRFPGREKEVESADK
ncbi:MAG: trypsin-like peptidase domain-containing protein [Planctomycetia bacterium]|nr:trypsin-like peptidase domain-containing protein [Planctomycetia bacterium]